MGNVLIDYQPMEYTRRFFPDETEAHLVYNTLFDSPVWDLLDAGGIEPQEAIEKVCASLPEPLRPRTRELFAHWYDHLTLIPETNELGAQLKQNGYRLYILSNAATSFHAYAPTAIPLYPLLDGLVVSADEKLVKPDPAIYRLLCKRYALSTEECFFIDDRLENVEAARRCGMAAHQYMGNIQELRASLQEAGVSV